MHTYPIIIHKQQLKDDLYLKEWRVNRKIAFMMAWHPRLGKNCLIPKFMGRDIGRWFCEQYLDKQKYDKEIKIKFSPPKPSRGRNQILLIPIRLSHSTNYTYPVYIQTPWMMVPFGLKYKDMYDRTSIALNIDNDKFSHERFQDNIRHIEKLLITKILQYPQLYRRGSTIRIMTELMSSCIKMNESYHTPLLCINFDDESLEKCKIYYKKTSYTLFEAYNKGLLKKGCVVRMILKIKYGWILRNSSRMGYSIAPTQIEVLDNKDPVSEEYCFADTSSESE